MTSFLTLGKRKQAFEELGRYLLSPDEGLQQLINTAQYSNAWFTPDAVKKAVKAWGEALNASDLNFWLPHKTIPNPKRIGLVLAGNIPMVGFHDVISVLFTGHTALIKPSSQDQKLIPHILTKLIEIEPGFAEQIKYVDRLEGFDAVIATGSNNTSRYFEHYFGKVPHIIRKNRNSIAVLTGKESTAELILLGEDIFTYFGLGCRNVSKVFVPENYNFNPFFEALETYKSVIDHHKYSNNYDYNKSIYLVNGDKHLDNGFLLLKKDQKLASPLAVLYFEEYKSYEELTDRLNPIQDQIQCMVINIKIETPIPQVGFGQSQKPKLWDYADGVNIIEFLMNL